MVLARRGDCGSGRQPARDVGFYAPWLVVAPFVLGWKFQRREILWVVASCVVFAVLAFGWFGYWFITDEHYRWVWNGWRESMRDESSRHPVSITNFRPYLMYFFISAPLVFLTLPFAPILEWRKRRIVADAAALASRASLPICFCF